MKWISRPKPQFVFIVLLCFAFGLQGCKEDGNAITGTAKIIVTNAALNSAPIQLMVDDEIITPTPIAYIQSSGTAANRYTEMNAGIRPVKLVPSASGASPLVEGNLVISPGKNYSMFAYDTLDALGHLKAMIVADELTNPATGKAKYRFFNLCPDSKFLDIQISRTGDTSKLNGLGYMGNNTPGNAIAVFREIDAAPFGISIKQTDSAFSLINGQSIGFEQGKIYSIYVRGLIKRGINTPQGFNISILQHN